MKEKILAQAELMLDETISNIQQLVRIDSSRNEALKEANKPFGPGVDQCFDTFLKMCEAMNMRTFKDPDGVYVYSEIGPEDGQLIGILGHLDVVPSGDISLWQEAKPFSGDVVNDKIVSRGSLDDKGPMVINLMALKALLATGYELKSRIRFIVGGAEETTWECIDKYKKEQEIPVVSYSPDAEFPLIYAEKTLLEFDGYQKGDYDFTITSNGAYNAVCDHITFKGNDNDTHNLINSLEKLNFAYQTNDDGSVSVLGKSAHAKDCDQGTNAALRLALAMDDAHIYSKTTAFLAKYVKETSFGELIFNQVISDAPSGNLTLNVGLLNIKDGEERIGFDSRIPVLTNGLDIKKQYIEMLQKADLNFQEVDYLEKLYVPEDSKLVQTLMKIYKEITHDDNAKPLSSGGATYSRAWDNCVAFGMLFPQMVDKMHQPDECLEIKYIIPALKIYTLAMYELDQITF